MTDKNDLAIQARDCTLGRRDVVGQRSERILHRDCVQAGLFEQRDHLGPPRAVSPCAVDKDDRRLASLCDDQVREGCHQHKKYNSDEARVHAMSPCRSRRYGSSLSSVMGNCRTRTPVALYTALATAAPAPQMPSSPSPLTPSTFAFSSKPSSTIASSSGMSACTGTR